jgi:hypothetical protein
VNVVKKESKEREARIDLYRKGIIAPWYLRPSQMDIYRLLKRSSEPFVEAARQFGKTTSILVHVLELLARYPGVIWRWCEPFKNQAREIVEPNILILEKDIPDEFRFRYVMSHSFYEHPRTKSRMYIRGVNEDKGDSARGPFAHGITADEYGMWRDGAYIVDEALRAQLQSTKGQLIFASTPSRDLGHNYYERKSQAIQAGRQITKIIWQNESLTKEQIQEICDKCGGDKSAAWRREYLCEPVADIESLVIPEFSDSHVECFTGMPQFCDRYVGADLGLNDFTAFLFGHYDFQSQILRIEDEFFIRGANTRQVVEGARAKEKERWQDVAPYKRVGDNEKQQLYDMQTEHGYTLLPTRKDDKLAAINALRLRFAQGKIKIHPRCENLIFQLKVGMWNDRKSDFLRGEKTGHLDGIDALIYLNRNVDIHHNPVPPLYGVDRWYSIIPETTGLLGNDEQILKDAFAGTRGRGLL